MSKNIAGENLLSSFPMALASDEKLLALASITATELCELIEENDLITLYARIDELDEPLLDILAYDFKVDWWNYDYSIDEKRKTLKSLWHIHRKLGVPYASTLALSAVFENAEIVEWHRYDGRPYYFKIRVKSGETLVDYGKLTKVVEGIEYYKNERSRLESFDIEVEKNAAVYVGAALQVGSSAEFNLEEVDFNNYTILVDENGVVLLDENGFVLLD